MRESNMKQSNDTVVTLSNGEVNVWVDEGSAIHLKCVTRFGDPVELNVEEAKELIGVLERLVHEIE
jgi:hypothetical protein